MSKHTDHTHMQRALALAENGRNTTTPNPSVGCVLIGTHGAVIGEGWSQPAGQNHAEVQALNDARARGADPRGATAYVTLEPCSHHGRTPPCCDALIAAGIARVVAAIEDPNPLVAGRGLARLRAAGIDVDTGVLADEARESLAGFLSRIERGRPFVRLKVAASIDGKTALANGISQWITSEAAREDVHRWRARACAMITGIGTVLADDPQLNVRAIPSTRQPVRVVLDSRLRTPPAAAILREGGTLIATASQDAAARTALETAGAVLLDCGAPDGKVDIPLLLAQLGSRGFNEVMVEAGSTLNAAFIASGLVDEYLFYLAPLLLGRGARDIAALPAIKSMSEGIRLRLHAFTQVGTDLRVQMRLGPA